jgi:hypothetical protein
MDARKGRRFRRIEEKQHDVGRKAVILHSSGRLGIDRVAVAEWKCYTCRILPAEKLRIEGDERRTSENSLADLILIAVNRKQQHVKSIAANYRKVPTRSAVTVESKRNRPASNETETVTEDADVEPQTEDAVCTCTSSDRTSCIATRHFVLRMEDIQRRN